MRHLAETAAALAALACAGCSPMTQAGGPPAPVTAAQAQALVASRGYSDIRPFYRAKDSASWETRATIDGVPYIVDVDNDGMIVAR